MPTIASKKQLFENAGYTYVFDRMIYVNRNAKKVFSVEFIEEHNETELEARINDSGPQDGQWHFYFNSPPSESVKQQLSAILK